MCIYNPQSYLCGAPFSPPALTKWTSVSLMIFFLSRSSVVCRLDIFERLISSKREMFKYHACWGYSAPQYLTTFGLCGREACKRRENESLQAKSKTIGFIIDQCPTELINRIHFGGGIQKIHLPFTGRILARADLNNHVSWLFKSLIHTSLAFCEDSSGEIATCFGTTGGAVSIRQTNVPLVQQHFNPTGARVTDFGLSRANSHHDTPTRVPPAFYYSDVFFNHSGALLYPPIRDSLLANSRHLAASE